MIILEPHADDAFLSMGGHLLRWKKEGRDMSDIKIVTVYGTEKRAKEAQAYATLLGVEYEWLGLIEAGAMDATIPEPTLPDFAGRIIYAPLGLRHDEHYAVHNVARLELTKRNEVRYYVDMPYALQQKNESELEEKLHGRRVWSVCRPNARKYHVAEKIFKSQSRFWYYNKEMVKWITEMTVR